MSGTPGHLQEHLELGAQEHLFPGTAGRSRDAVSFRAMKRFLRLWMVMLAAVLASPGVAGDEPPVPEQRTYVLVHGAWGGGWAWRDVADRLRARGHEAYRPTLTGLGERRHLVSLDVGLATHIEDVVNVLVFEQLRNVVLVGHSYGGMVISGVADRVPERIAHRVYIDAFVPEDGESIAGEDGPDEWLRKMTGDGLVVPPWVGPDQEPPHDVPHPLRSFTDRLRLESEAAKRIPTTYILTMGPGAQTDDFSAHAARARARGWAVEVLEADHNPQWSKPAELTDLLDEAPTVRTTG